MRRVHVSMSVIIGDSAGNRLSYEDVNQLTPALCPQPCWQILTKVAAHLNTTGQLVPVAKRHFSARPLLLIPEQREQLAENHNGSLTEHTEIQPAGIGLAFNQCLVECCFGDTVETLHHFPRLTGQRNKMLLRLFVVFAGEQWQQLMANPIASELRIEI